jgi:hypothetical protein
LLILELLLELLDLFLELFVLVLESLDVDGGRGTQVALDVVEGIGRPVRLLVQADQNLYEGVQYTSLLQVPAELLLP